MSTGNSPKFSIVVIARNEARSLPRLVQSLRDFIAREGDLLLVDTGSSDLTKEVAANLGCRVVEGGTRFDATLSKELAHEINLLFSRNGEGPLVSAGQRMFHFANAREYATTFAHHRFVLHVDAGDELIALDIDFLNEHISSSKSTRFIYWREFLSENSSHNPLSYNESRFYDREAYRWEGYAHEAIYPQSGSMELPSACVVCTKQELFERHHKNEGKSRAYLPALGLDLLDKPDNPRWQHYLGRELYYFHWYRSAIQLLEKSASAKEAWQAERSESLCLAGSCYEALEETERARECYLGAFDIDGSRREPLIRLANLYCRTSNFRAAVDFASAALKIPRTSAYMEFEANYTYVPHAILYWSLYWLGDRQRAHEHWQACIQFEPDGERFRQHAMLF